MDSPKIIINDTYEAQCELSENLNKNVIYRTSLHWSFIVSLFAFFAQSFFIIKRLLKIRFQKNLKCLLLVYFVSSLLFSIELVVGFGYEVFAPYFVTVTCGLLINPMFFKIWHVISIFTMTIQMLLPLGFTLERSYALWNAETYEFKRLFIGPLLAALLILTDALCVFLIFSREQFAGPFVSLVLVPSTSALQFNIFLFSLLGVQVFNLIGTTILLKLNAKLQKKQEERFAGGDHKYSMSLKYQMREINEASKFTRIVSFTHLLFAGCYIICGLLARVYGLSFFTNTVNYTAARAMYCSVPTYNLIIVFIGIWLLNRVAKERKITRVATLQVRPAPTTARW